MPAIYLQRMLRFAIVVGVVLIAFLTVFTLARYTYPFLIAIVIAFLINPVVNLFEHKLKIPRAFSVFLVILLILALVSGIITILIVEIANGMTYLSTVVPKYFEDLVKYFQNLVAAQVIPLYERLSAMLDTLDPAQKEQIMNQIKDVGSSIADSGKQLLTGILTWIPEQLRALPNLATVLIFSLLGTFFISKDWYKLGERIQILLPDRLLTSGSNVFKGLQKALFGFIKAQLTLISITAVIVLIGLLILRVDYAITIALITGVVDLLPYLGTGIIFVPWILYVFFTKNFFLTIGLSVLYIIVIVQRQLMEPKVLSTNIGLDPLATLVALFVGFQLFGFLGLIIGPVALVIINTLHQTGVLREVWDFIIGPKKV
ncbi:MAG: sporulation integral membrane protein YtvI [Bacillaceae bacterium]|nr:sporulation integral membrane protein YtvI [Bacillaceae bacterium]